MVFSGTKSLCRSVGWYIKARAILFLYSRRLLLYIVDGTTQKLKEFRFVPSANTRAALDDVLLLVKRPRSIKTRDFMFSETSVEKRATKALFRFYPRPLLSQLGLRGVLKYATRNWQLAPRARKQAVSYTRIRRDFVHFWQKREKNLLTFCRRFFRAFLCFATRNDV